MKQVKAVGVKELKNNLSAYLRDVQAGGVVLVSDRSRVVAELRQPSTPGTLSASEAQTDEWVRDGRLVAPSGLKQHLERSPVRLPAGSSRRLLDQDRADS
jgi:antitoxin (DNA-binding transcriptional repressor) of toxin-antitoxin stability system